MLILTTILFAESKLQALLNRKSPSITSYTQSVEEGSKFDTNEEDFVIAFALENFFDGLKDDPRFVQWIAKYSYAESDGTYHVINYPMHRCTDEEMAKFDPPDQASKVKVERYKQVRGFYCFEMPEKH